VLRVTGWNRPLLMQVSRRVGTEPPSSDVPIVAIDRAAAQGRAHLPYRNNTLWRTREAVLCDERSGQTPKRGRCAAGEARALHRLHGGHEV
jgi:hypothetical protein